MNLSVPSELPVQQTLRCSYGRSKNQSLCISCHMSDKQHTVEPSNVPPIGISLPRTSLEQAEQVRRVFPDPIPATLPEVLWTIISSKLTYIEIELTIFQTLTA